MGRTPGAKNKNISETNNLLLLEKNINIEADNNDIFYADLLDGHRKWKAAARKLKDAGQNADRELQFAEYYLLGLANFTKVEIKE